MNIVNRSGLVSSLPGCLLVGAILFASSAWAQTGFTGLGVHATFVSEADALPGDPPAIEELEIIKVDLGSPAARAGIKVGDRVVSIENCGIPGCSAARARQLLALSPGDEITLLMQRGSEQYSADIVAVAPPASVEGAVVQ